MANGQHGRGGNHVALLAVVVFGLVHASVTRFPVVTLTVMVTQRNRQVVMNGVAQVSQAVCFACL